MCVRYRVGVQRGGSRNRQQSLSGGAEARLIRIISKITTVLSAKKERHESAVGDSWGGLSAKLLTFLNPTVTSELSVAPQEPRHCPLTLWPFHKLFPLPGMLPPSLPTSVLF